MGGRDSMAPRHRRSLEGNAPPECLSAIEIWFGHSGRVLARIATERGAAMIVVGGKRHALLDRWFAGSTALDTVRRVLVAVDFSAAARRTIEAACHIAELVGAELRVLHAFEPVTSAALVPTPFESADSSAAAAVALEQAMPPEVVSERDVERVVRPGWARQVIAQEVAEWDAQLVVVGSHRKD